MICETDCRHLDKDNNCTCREECGRLHNDMYEKSSRMRGKRASMNMVEFDGLPLFDEQTLDEVLSKFLGKERFGNQDVDNDIHLSSS